MVAVDVVGADVAAGIAVADVVAEDMEATDMAAARMAAADVAAADMAATDVVVAGLSAAHDVFHGREGRGVACRGHPSRNLTPSQPGLALRIGEKWGGQMGEGPAPHQRTNNLSPKTTHRAYNLEED